MATTAAQKPWLKNIIGYVKKNVLFCKIVQATQ